MEPRPATPPRPAAPALERAPRAAFVLPGSHECAAHGDRARSSLSARLRADGWRALAERVSPGPLAVVDDVRAAVARRSEVIVIEARAAAREIDVLRAARAWARIVLVAGERDADCAAALSIDLDARCASPSSRARNRVVAKLSQHVPTWLALLRTTVIHDPIPARLGETAPPRGPRPLVTHWSNGRDLGAVLDAFRAARARRSDLRLRVLVDSRAAPPRRVPPTRVPGVEMRAVQTSGDVACEFAASGGLYHPIERWPDASIAAPAIANAVGVPAFVSARCAAAEAVEDRGELLATDGPDALLASQLHVAASPEPRRASGEFGVTDVALRWLEEVSAVPRH